MAREGREELGRAGNGDGSGCRGKMG
jgi:hypothetical protein